jgi:hypothetical protein
MTVAQIRDRRLGMLRGRQPAAGALGHSDNVASWPVDASDEIALDNYLQQASYDVAFDELFEAKSVFYKGQEYYAIGSRCGRALSTAAREKGRR